MAAILFGLPMFPALDSQTDQSYSQAQPVGGFYRFLCGFPTLVAAEDEAQNGDDDVDWGDKGKEPEKEDPDTSIERIWSVSQFG
jgi:hypothetical protein